MERRTVLGALAWGAALAGCGNSQSMRKRLKGSHGGDAEPHLDIPRYVRLVQDGKLDFSALVSAHYPLEEANEAIAAIRSGVIPGRCLLVMT